MLMSWACSLNTEQLIFNVKVTQERFILMKIVSLVLIVNFSLHMMDRFPFSLFDYEGLRGAVSQRLSYLIFDSRRGC
jgi:hypothetical protein